MRLPEVAAFFEQKHLLHPVGIPLPTRYHACVRTMRMTNCGGNGMQVTLMMRRIIVLVALCVSPAGARTFPQEGGATAASIPDMRWAVKIPLRDGVLLNATIFLPLAQKAPLPVFFTLPPTLVTATWIARCISPSTAMFTRWWMC